MKTIWVRFEPGSEENYEEFAEYVKHLVDITNGHTPHIAGAEEREEEG